ncbi:hypothetical protein PFISCL1PPCAC_18628, partial [Pristionchus fissidentatus]
FLAGQYGTRQVFTHDLIFCSVTLTPTDGIAFYDVFHGDVYDEAFPSVRFTLANMISDVVYTETAYTFWYNDHFCNPDDVSTS